VRVPVPATPVSLSAAIVEGLHSGWLLEEYGTPTGIVELYDYSVEHLTVWMGIVPFGDQVTPELARFGRKVIEDVAVSSRIARIYSRSCTCQVDLFPALGLAGEDCGRLQREFAHAGSPCSAFVTSVSVPGAARQLGCA
jgi:hypothetical protein